MQLLCCRIRNYMSFSDSGKTIFAPGINVVVGPNNAGKTALVEALSRKHFSSSPHKRLSNGQPEISANPSTVEIDIQLSEGELRQLVMASPGNLRFNGVSGAGVGQQIDNLLSRDAASFRLARTPDKDWSHPVPDTTGSTKVRVEPDGSIVEGFLSGVADRGSLDAIVGGAFDNSLFMFRAERL